MPVRGFGSALGLALLLLGACSPEDSTVLVEPSGTPTANALPCPLGGLCGSTNGVIHDGTGNGTLTIVPNDPTPGAPGVWLGDTLSGRWCFADFNANVVDADHDWLDDDCEFWLAKAFAPVVAMDPDDGCPLGEPYWAAKYISAQGGAGGYAARVRIAYLPAYYQDCGSGGHTGDSETLMLSLYHNPNTRHWELFEAWVSAHALGPISASEYITDPTMMQYPQKPLTYPLVWIARGKHGFYRTQYDCNNRALFNDHCEANVAMGRMRVYSNHNVGGRSLDNFPSGVPSANPLYSGNGRREFFYTPVNFNGWQPFGAGVTPYATFLNLSIFECFDPSYQFAGGPCVYGGGSPTSPGATPLVGVINGPTSVTGNQSYIWSSFVTGGVVPYRAEWYRKYASLPTAIHEGTTTGSWTTTNSTAGGIPLTIDRCENFTLTATFTSTDGKTFTDTHAVTIASCPPPVVPLSVSINGPGAITVKATYTYTAVTSGFSGQTYSWSQRYCLSGSCQAWTTLVGFTTTVGRVLGPDCSGNKNNWYEIRVTVRNSDGRSVTATKQSGLCGGLN
jgi:hypothetical protein